jgi:HEAT repeat protein
MMAGIALALIVSSAGGLGAVWEKISTPLQPQGGIAAASPAISNGDLDRQRPQKQAEILMARAVSRSGEAPAQIAARVDGWRGKLKWNSQLGDLTTVAMNSSDQTVRESAIEVQLAAYGLSKSESTVDALVKDAASADHARKIWALWALGLLGNRGIETERVVEVLAAQLSDGGPGSEDSRRWAVEGLALVGTTPTIAPLLSAMHNDPSALVRERAACSLAQSGMLSHEQRLMAVPQLINFSSDPALDAQTHAWAFQALTDITGERLPNDATAWHNWFENHRTE